MSDDNDDSESGSDASEGARAARERLAPKTQRDYSGYINELVEFACRRREEFADPRNEGHQQQRQLTHAL
jgi:hypothetical protein